MKKSLILSLIIFAMPAWSAYAEDMPKAAVAGSAHGITSGIESLAESLDFISAIKNGKKPTDAIALQTALNGVISLSEEEIRNLEGQLRSLAWLKEEDDAVQEDYLDKIAGFRARIKTAKDEANRDIGVDDILKIARNLKEWRDTAYAPRIRLMIDFVAVMQNEKAIMTAHERLIAITKDEKKIRGFFMGGRATPFLKLLKKAQGEIAQATDMSNEAKRLLAAEQAGNGGDGGIDAAVEGSNALVNAAYDDFVAMSKLVRK